MRAADGRNPPERDRAADNDRSPQAASIAPGAEPVPPCAGGGRRTRRQTPDTRPGEAAPPPSARHEAWRGGASPPPAGAHGGGEKRGRRRRKSLTKKKARPEPAAGRTDARGDGHRAQRLAPARASSPASLSRTTPPLSLHFRGRRLRRACDAPAAEERVLRLIVSDPQTGVAPGWTRGRKVRSKCR